MYSSKRNFCDATELENIIWVNLTNIITNFSYYYMYVYYTFVQLIEHLCVCVCFKDRINQSTGAKKICRATVEGNIGRGRLRRTLSNEIENVPKISRASSEKNKSIFSKD